MVRPLRAANACEQAIFKLQIYKYFGNNSLGLENKINKANEPRHFNILKQLPH